MGRLREIIARLAGTLRRRRSDADIDEELRSHLAFAEDEARRRGAPVRDARLRAGSAASAADAVRDQGMAHVSPPDLRRVSCSAAPNGRCCLRSCPARPSAC